MSEISILAIDLAKGSLQVFGDRADGTVILNKLVSRPRLYQLLGERAHCIVAMEACATSHHWGRVAQSYGHEVRLVFDDEVQRASRWQAVMSITVTIGCLP
ncbi:hypothetical protein SAMN04490248_12067 [Salinihabitans flavidus]|uniref:Transposase n=1 Tax=Salinihabitans flavidus TaxID=569882 RepID=A0A1H8UJU4_9RHOB|nr:transposase [Salinihabitans flavidus]SEP03510.1 hypothetical protein SAMN04490248_12067 [Salinihabitans flavidus]